MAKKKVQKGEGRSTRKKATTLAAPKKAIGKKKKPIPKKKPVTKKKAKAKAAEKGVVPPRPRKKTPKGSGGKSAAKKKTPPKKRSPATAASQGDAHRKRMAKRSRQQFEEVREIGPPPERNQERWDRYHNNLFLFLTEVFPDTTGLKPFSLDHRRIIDSTQHAILKGGRLLRIVFRGFAKSTILENAAIWSEAYGHREFFLSIGADAEASRLTLDSIQSEFIQNDELMEIFPAVCHCAQALDGHPQRASGQMINGERTHIVWTKQECVLPMVEGFEGSGRIIRCKGITGNLRGSRFKRADGKQVRPDFVAVDDPQTDQSAASPVQCARRLRILQNTILQLGGHFTKIACVVNATIIEPDDMVDQLSDRDEFPMWRTDKVPILKSLSKVHETDWLGKYAEIRTTYNPHDDDDRDRAIEDSNEYYRQNRQRMDEGADAAWEHCFDDGEVSAIQHAYNKLIEDGEETFEAEYQNAPVRDTGGLIMLPPGDIATKTFSHDRGEVPLGCDLLTGFIDVHPKILYNHIWGWRPSEDGFLVDDSTEPKQRLRYFSHSHIRQTLGKKFGKRDMEAAVWAGLDAMIPPLIERTFMRQDDRPQRIKRILIDANGEAKDVVFDYIANSPYGALLTPSFGHAIGANGKPMSMWQQSRKRGVGPNWVPTKGRSGEPPGVMFESNYWKTRFHRRLALAKGSKGGLYLYRAKASHHRRIADSWWAEKPKQVKDMYEWKKKHGQDNHDFDCAVGSMVGASIEGVGGRQVAGRKRMSLKEIQQKKRRRQLAGR